jgi:hypothetical protein
MVKGDSPSAGDPHKHLSTLDGWREFTTLSASPPDLLAEAEYAALGSDAKAAYDEERLDYHTRLGVAGTSVLRQVVTAGRRLTLLNRHAISARRGRSCPARPGLARPPRSPSSARPTRQPTGHATGAGNGSPSST